MQAIGEQITSSAAYMQAIANLQASVRQSIDLSPVQVALRWYTQNQRAIDSITEMIKRSYPTIELKLGNLAKNRPAPAAEKPTKAEVEETLAAFEAAREEAGSEPASQLEKFFDEDVDIDQNVTGLTNIEDPVVQERIKKVIRWIIDLMAVLIIAGNLELALAMGSCMAIFDVSTKDLKALADKTVQKVIDNHLANKEVDQDED